MTLIDRVRASVAQHPAASLCVRCILVGDSRRALVATMVRMVQLAGVRATVQANPNNSFRTRHSTVSADRTPPATLRTSTHVAEGA